MEINSSEEGGLRAPKREPLNTSTPDFWDKDSVDKEMRRQFDVCHSCRRCFNLCDSFPRLFDLIDNSSSMELDTVQSSDFIEVTDACTLCDMCFMVTCPYVPPHEFSIDIPSLILRSRAIDFKEDNHSRVSNELTKIDRNAKFAQFFVKALNWIMNKSNIFTRKIIEIFLNIDKKASLPKYSKKTLLQRYPEESLEFKEVIKETDKKVVLYSGCYANYQNTNIGDATVNVLKHNGINVKIVYPECCGMPTLELGNLEEVKQKAIRIASVFKTYIDQGYDIVSPIPSCALMMKTHWPLLLPEDSKVKELSIKIKDIDEYIMDLDKNKSLKNDLNPINKNISLHLACHSRAQNIGSNSSKMLNLIPQSKVNTVFKCSGHGGIWGIKRKWHSIALKLGKPLVRALKKEDSNYIASTCPLAALHIEDIFSILESDKRDLKVYHPIELLALSYGILNEKKENT